MERTLCIIKPDAVKKNVQGNIIRMISENGFRIIGMRLIKLTSEQAGKFYAIHKERPFFKDLVEFMTSGACIPIALERENAVAEWRKLIGATDPAEAEEGTIRKLFANSKSENAVHGSDSVENGKIEVGFFFPESEII
ncbi:MAG: nucleoside-diphosphate kinase [Ignavibacteriaceae bacterium]|jgi:nucleoside-diphosphate kinase|nr:MAG: nucleoside-diphosphate kinase [Chlorobiota bacterium]MBV6398005.1 Nucleoside diphosphate kinase [Ignavibacteria bacterium]MCC6886452.1 nucleoside-diphosphate kinase [Ignavibacteriales bacterium]MCE7952472.1 nucleoside-diphosphate kinase [Chlorobi bacterium CHB7]MDL1886588.1 nucleoside-diphosphate kinase [Ignavibacteria bacterium CHB1]MEB2329693.1 nucleoside-diphosphate kinase [Ignavibacteriaceae bacterium]OQY77311.1 MAG: nucleoside-diphosphate kinase [Ignavibacteriales bacterium UTCHB